MNRDNRFSDGTYIGQVERGSLTYEQVLSALPKPTDPGLITALLVAILAIFAVCIMAS